MRTGHQLDTLGALYAKLLKLWRSLGDSNPCFRRERAILLWALWMGLSTRIQSPLSKCLAELPVLGSE
jgi:hypothetical protein